MKTERDITTDFTNVKKQNILSNLVPINLTMQIKKDKFLKNMNYQKLSKE